MGVWGKLILFFGFAGAVLVGLIAVKLNALFEVPPVPKLEETWWGPGQPSKVDTSIKPFKINVPEKVLLDLNARLKNARPFPRPLEGIQQQYGFNTDLLKEVVDFWKTKYDWREREKFLNKYPQYTTNIQGLDIHFLHVKPENPSGLKVVPLLISHGWPGSVREFYEIIPLLTNPRKGRDFVFEVVVPAIPGYGFSDGATRPGMGPAQISVVFKNLMLRLGFERFYVQGGDWSSRIMRNMAVLFPNHVLGMHSNMCSADSALARIVTLLGSFWPSLVIDKKYEHRLYPISETVSYVLKESGYMHIQATKPDTVGVALNDSPVGLAAYILEKFVTGTNDDWNGRSDGGLKEKYSYTDLLDNIMYYWVTNSKTTAMRLYAEEFSREQRGLNMPVLPVLVPTACAKFENEVFYTPDSLLRLTHKNLVHSVDIDGVGHFAAFEEPELLADDVWIAIGKMETYHQQKNTA